MRISVAVCLAVLGAACVDQTPVTPSAKVVVVHAVIDAASKDQFVVVQTTTGVETQQRDVAGARVTITTPNAAVLVADQVQDTTSRIAGVAPVVSTRYKLPFARIGAIVPGGTYRLHVVLPDGREVNGTTTVPDASMATTTAPLPDLRYDSDTLSLGWPAAKGASAFEVFIESERASFTMFADTTISLPGRADNAKGTSAFWPGYQHRVIVSAVDANYYDYYRRTSDDFTGRGIISRLDGGVGVFGSIVPVASYSFMVR